MFQIELTESIRSKSLHDLRDEEERQLDGMLLENSHRVLKDDRVVVEPRLEVRDGGDGRDGSPEEEPLV